MTMVEIPAGHFMRGQADGEWDEQPVHEVKISQPFHLSATEVTNAQYEEFDPGHRRYRGIRGVSKADDEAVVHVSWYDAMRFCKWLSQKEGKPYRLPTEAEWEYACRAETKTPFHTGETLPRPFHRNQPVEGDWNKVRRKKDEDLREKKGKIPVDLTVASMPPNAFELYEMHGNVEEWCLDWYGPYPESRRIDPRGPRDGITKVTRGGSHNTYVRHLRSANRLGALPADRHWLIGFRIVQAEYPQGQWENPVQLEAGDATVSQEKMNWAEPADEPIFIAPEPFVIRDLDTPWLAALDHHHHPTLTWCENGDLLALWYNTRSEIGREMIIVGSRLRAGNETWDQLRPFLIIPDRNTTGSNLLNDGKGNLIWLNAISESSHHRDQCMVMLKSLDQGRTWSKPRIISNLDRRRKYTPEQSSFVSQEGHLIFSVDTAPIGFKANECGSGVYISKDGGETWIDRVGGKGEPTVKEKGQGGLIAGFHPAIVELTDGSLMAMARTRDIDGHMTKSTSHDMGKTWHYTASPFPGVGGGQRPVLLRLEEGPIFFASFADKENDLVFTDPTGKKHKGTGLFAALSFDEGATWKHLRLLTAGKEAGQVDGGGNTGTFVMDDTHAEPKGYLAVCQTPDGTIHLISSRLHYRFNLHWLKTLKKN
jgi:formylglycine-generating enzyme required for sulfatase activity